MLILISPAKTFATKPANLPSLGTGTCPLFIEQAQAIARGMALYNTQDLSKILKVKFDKASQVVKQWHEIALDEGVRHSCLEYYSGIVFKYLDVHRRSNEAIAYANQNLRICSFAYGLLRPSDRITPYRLEGAVHVDIHDKSLSIFEYWRDILTPHLIEECKRVAEGKLLFLASEEMKHLFHWTEVEKQLDVYTPYFYTQSSEGLKQKTVYTKMARGAMLASVLEAQTKNPIDILAFKPLGYSYAPEHSSEKNWYFILQE